MRAELRGKLEHVQRLADEVARDDHRADVAASLGEHDERPQRRCHEHGHRVVHREALEEEVAHEHAEAAAALAVRVGEIVQYAVVPRAQEVLRNDGNAHAREHPQRVAQHGKHGC